MKHQAQQNERRNYYRILNVQPDASLEIIKSNYRTLLQKLRLHPDLGGKDWNASIINEAYNTLRSPEKRAAYDEKLLKQHCVRKLSRGHLVNHKKTNSLSANEKDTHGNQRNFYRLFNIQPDAPASIIKTSYLTLLKQSNIPKELLDEAYRILGDEKKRALYDKLITQHHHGDAVDKLTMKKTTNSNLGNAAAKLSAYTNSQQTAPVRTKQAVNSTYYQPVITQYCAFCKTPHAQSPCRDTAPLCGECDSPLFPPSKTFAEQQRRDIVRLSDNSHVQFYTYWPGKLKNGKVIDISPLGMQLISPVELTKDQILKIDSTDFKAVGAVSYINTDNQAVGIQFLTVNFNKTKGQFFYESA